MVSPPSSSSQDEETERERVSVVLEDVMMRWALVDQVNGRGQQGKKGEVIKVDREDVEEAVTYLGDEVREEGISLPLPGTVEEDEQTSLSLSLEELQSHPLHDLLCRTLIELLSWPPQRADESAPFMVEEILSRLSAPLDSTAAEGESKMTRLSWGPCELCERQYPLTSHHLLPRSEHDFLLRKNLYSTAEMHHRRALLCRPCHSTVHKTFTSRELAMEYNTMDKLLADERIRKWGKYASGLRGREKGETGKGLKHKR